MTLMLLPPGFSSIWGCPVSSTESKLQPVKHIKPVTIYDMKLEAVRKHPCFHRFKSHSKKETEMGGMKGEPQSPAVSAVSAVSAAW